MFRGINLCGAEVNTKFSEQHRTHLLHSHIKFIVISFSSVVKSAKPFEIARNAKINSQWNEIYNRSNTNTRNVK